MSGIDGRRVLLGGVLAGIVINLSEFLLNGVVLMDAMEASMAAAGGGFAPWAMVFFVAMAFLWGLGLALAYAAVRPRLGPGPRTALVVGVGGWLYLSVLPTLGSMAMGYAGGSLVGISLAWTLVELPLATAVAGWAYQEDPGVARVRAP